MTIIFVPSILANNLLHRFNRISKQDFEKMNHYDKEYIVRLNQCIGHDNKRPSVSNIDLLETNVKTEDIIVEDENVIITIKDSDADEIIRGGMEVMYRHISRLLDLFGEDKGREIVAKYQYYL